MFVRICMGNASSMTEFRRRTRGTPPSCPSLVGGYMRGGKSPKGKLPRGLCWRLQRLLPRHEDRHGPRSFVSALPASAVDVYGLALHAFQVRVKRCLFVPVASIRSFPILFAASEALLTSMLVGNAGICRLLAAGYRSARSSGAILTDNRLWA
jgi:hypothetical protein